MNKKLLLLLVVLSFSLSVQSQHLAFKGIEMNGSVASFATKLQPKGFIKESTHDDVISLKGPFDTYNNCIVLLFSNAQGNIRSVVVNFPEQNTLEGINKNYSNIRSFLVEKYGAPTIVSEKYGAGLFENHTDNVDVSQIKENGKYYGCEWSLSNGDVQLSLTDKNVQLLYVDRLAAQQTTPDVNSIAVPEVALSAPPTIPTATSPLSSEYGNVPPYAYPNIYNERPSYYLQQCATRLTIGLIVQISGGIVGGLMSTSYDEGVSLAGSVITLGAEITGFALECCAISSLRKAGRAFEKVHIRSNGIAIDL